jgi:hypothetical protein
MADRKVFPLRLKTEDYEALRRWADDELRSVNAQIEYLVGRALREAGRLPKRAADPAPSEKRKDAE